MPFIPINSKRILDIGCGGGNFAVAVQKRNNAEVWGVEPDEEACKIAESKLRKVLCGTIERVESILPTSFFDVIIFNDVLEHMVNPQTALGIAKNALIDNGIIVVSLPNVRYFQTIVELLYRKDWQYQDSGILDRTHLRFYTEKSARRMFEEEGFTLLSVDGINPIKNPWFKVFNLISLGYIRDMKFLQHVFVLSIKR